jgi:hypothetical protein
MYLLHNRLEPDMDGGVLKRRICWFHHYLRIPTTNHCRALTRILLSTHTFTSERLRWYEQHWQRVSFEERKCRLCTTNIETREHALDL